MRVLNSSQLSKSLPLPFNNSINRKGARQFPVRLPLKREYGHHPNIQRKYNYQKYLFKQKR